MGETWAAADRSLILYLFGVSAVAVSLAFLAQYPRPELLDLIALPALAGVLLFLFFGVLTRRVPHVLAARVAYVAFAAYLLASLVYQLVHFVPHIHRLTEVTYWFPVVYCTAYIAWPHRAAVAWATGTYAASVLIGVAFLPYLHARNALSTSILAFEAQFYGAGLAAILLLNHMTRLQHHYGTVRMQAYADFLTGLPNRRYGERVLQQVFRKDDACAVVLFDLDHFKSVNDQHGHDVGDLVLRGAAQVSLRNIPGDARIVRWGGEEFLIVVPSGSAAEAAALAERIRIDLASQDFSGVTPVTASFGVAARSTGDTPDLLVRRADAALYRAKADGRNRVSTQPGK